MTGYRTMTRDHCPDLDKLARRLQHRCQRHLLPNGSSANATDNILLALLLTKHSALLERNYSASLSKDFSRKDDIAFVMYTHKITALTIRSLHTIQCRPKQSTKQCYFRFEAKIHLEYSKFKCSLIAFIHYKARMMREKNRKEKRRKGSIALQDIFANENFALRKPKYFFFARVELIVALSSSSSSTSSPSRCRRITPYSLSTLPAAIRRHARSVSYVCTTAVFIAPQATKLTPPFT
ncbi:hypothetical protein G5I_09359 [Acromyrmex echinatior]|uniref:Uncharacterized protein n=1 Tax=Acromyrmex echinatior TaxID=103372 RepID=F4WU06_ACREC|nr:hypothetical protein G5I_09359 [Acromyrmex echinatior]